jgi:hypothetical protein
MDCQRYHSLMAISAFLNAATVVFSVGILLACSREEMLAGGNCPSTLKHWGKPSEGIGALAIINTVRLDGEKIYWNNQSITRNKLAEYSGQTAKMTPRPQLQFDPSKAVNCSFAAQMRDIIDTEAQCRKFEGMCGQGTTCQWKNAPMISDVLGPDGPYREYPPQVPCD